MDVHTEERDALPLYPMRRTAPLEPPPGLLQRLTQPVSKVRLASGQEAWLLTRYEDVVAMLADRTLSSDVTMPGYPRLMPGLIAFGEGNLDHLDPPEHDVYRRMLAPSFMVKRIQRLTAEVEELVDGLIDEMLKMEPPVDLVTSMAIGLPGMVTCALLGVPYADREFYVQCVETFTGGAASVDAIRAARTDLQNVLLELISSRRTQTDDRADDLISRMVRDFVVPGEITDDQLVDFAVLVLTAGFDTTWNMLALGIVTLFQHPDQLALFRGDPSALAPSLVEELLRFLSVPQLGRVKAVTQRVEIGGQEMLPGEGIVASLATANWDPSVFEAPDVLDITRPFKRHHLTFGHGVHQCLGAALARLELQIAFRALITRIPTLRLAIPFDQLEFKYDSFVYGVKELPIEW